MSLFKTETRIQIVGVFFLFGIAAIIARLWFLQVVDTQFWKDKIRTNGQVTLRIPSVRGEIRDRNGLPLVTNRASHEVNFYLSEMERGYRQLMGAKHVPTREYQTTVAGVLQTRREVDINRIVQDTVIPRFGDLDLEDEYNAANLQLHFRNERLVPFTFMEDIDFAAMAKLSEHDVGLPGVRVTDRPVRQYVYDSLASHILGYVGPVDTNRKDIKEEARKFKFYQADVEGKNNIEASMDKYLRGKPGVSYVQQNAKGVIEDEIGVTPPTPGANVYLTIDARIQTIAENAMRQVGRGAAVVVDPNNGDILAMVSVPSFNPNAFIPSISSQNWKSLIQDDTNPLTNRAILGYAPGSTFKCVTALAGLRKGIGKNRYTCSGGVTYGNKYMKCWIASKGGSHGALGLEESIKFSCNAFYYLYGNAAGIDQIDEVGEMLGLGVTPDLGLSNEAAGVVPGPAWLAQNMPKDRWSQGYTANTSIGQGNVLCSPVQMALVSATLANGGISYHGRLVDKVVENDGTPQAKVVLQEKPQVRTNLLAEGLKAEDIEHVRKGMWRVVNDGGGTASKAKLKGIEVAGKTGTAQFWRNGQQDNHTWFICFAPYDKPKFAVCVFLQGAKSGGGTAAPIAARILEESFALEKNYQPTVKPLPPAVGNFNFVENITFETLGADAYASANPAPKPSDPSRPATPAVDSDDEESVMDEDENENANPDAPDKKNVDADRLAAVAAPAVRPEPDAAGRSARKRKLAAATPQVRAAVPVNPGEGDAPPEGGEEGGESAFGRSMRKFFHREAGAPETTADDANVRRQQRNVRRERDQAANRIRRATPAAQSNPPAQQQPPPRKKFLGLF